MKNSAFTPSEYAIRAHVHVNTVYRWLKRGLLPASKVKLFQRYRYFIPFDAVPPALKPGPIPRARA